MQRKIYPLFQALLITIFIFTTSGCAALFKKDERPNFLIIVTDDQRYDTMDYMPETQKLIFDQGATFAHGRGYQSQ